MRYRETFNPVEDHYVAFLSNGAGADPSSSSFAQDKLFRKKRRFLPRITTSKFAALTAIAVGATIVAGFLIVSFWGSFGNEPASHPSFASKKVLSFPQQTDNQFVQAFEEFVAKHGKAYPTHEEKARRFEVFKKNALYIDLHNAQNFTYTLAVNAMADLTFEEFKALHFVGYRKRGKFGAAFGDNTDWDLAKVDPLSLPASIDWRQRGCVSEVKDQRKCGSCWAFSASGAVEGAYCAKHGKLIELSEQQMVDCGGPEGNQGCNGGEMDDAFQYIMDHGGLCTEDDYPYTAHDDRCRDNECRPVVRVQRFADVPRKNENALMAAIALKGPISVGVQADQLPFQFYHSGVFDASCGKDLDHGVVAMGYGSEEGRDFWWIKNSWGTQWGDHGYMKLLRHSGSKAGQCGILLEPSYPIVE